MSVGEDSDGIPDDAIWDIESMIDHLGKNNAKYLVAYLCGMVSDLCEGSSSDDMAGLDKYLDGDYFRGALENCARTLACMFSGTRFISDGIGIGDVAGLIKPKLVMAAKAEAWGDDERAWALCEEIAELFFETDGGMNG